ncbi:MAG: ATP-binding cassette domain-containing protein [Proteobacteria bacterium]|nr:ATP-binding cassette domain-containing protein [Pseudomonadota bacterium]NIS71051.1 ATP-binding cassette domain-containing protein [Pseudomonadota bacterium]
MSLLEVEKIDVFYDDVQAVWGVSLNVSEGEVVGIIGANGAGKSTTLNTISGLIKPRAGRIVFGQQNVDHLPTEKIVESGIVQIPEARRLFPFMTVQENLEIGAYNPRAENVKSQTLREVFDLFPILQERRNQLARTLSGGEQQMLAVGRGLMAKPVLLMLDEPSLGLAPMLVRTVFDAVRQINEAGTTILLVEQDVRHSLQLSDRGYVLENGRVVMEGKGGELLEDPHIKKAYLGV